MIKPPVPTEEQEMMALAGWLDAVLGFYCWIHVPNESRRPMRERIGKDGRVHRYCPQTQRLKRQGLKPGFPDVMILVPPSRLPVAAGNPQYRGAAIELKRSDRKGKATPEQIVWLDALRDWGFAVQVCHGADEAIAWLQMVGYS